MEINKCLLTKSDCYKSGRIISPKGIVVHSTGANNPNLKRYVQPDDGILGTNSNGNHWNKPGIDKCVHAFIGKDKNGKVRCYQTLPWNYRPWGCGKGKNGSYNNSYIQFEICEDALTDRQYFEAAFKCAVQLCAKLSNEFMIPIKDIVSHHEAHERGFASNHGDCDHWLAKFGKDMDWFRQLVKDEVSGVSAITKVDSPTTNTSKANTSYKVKVTADVLRVRAGAGTTYKVNTTVKKDEVYTIIEEKNGWGKLKSGAGWISLAYTTKC